METNKQPLELDREKTIEKLRQLTGVSLWALASYYNVLYLDTAEGVNTAWIDNTLEEYLGLPRASSCRASFYDEGKPWYLELVSFINLTGTWVMWNNLATTRIEETDPLPEFRESRLYSWITRYVALGIGYFETRQKPEPQYEVVVVQSFDITVPKNRVFLEEIEADYELVRAVVGRENGYSMLTCYMTKWLDPPLTRSHDFGFMDYWFYEA